MSRQSENNTGKTSRTTHFRNEDVHSPYHEGQDEIEYLRAGGLIRPDRGDLDSMSTPGSFRTYSHSDTQDGDDDFDSSYGDDEKTYNNRGAEERFMSGENENNDYGSSSGYGTHGQNSVEKEDEKFGAASGYGNYGHDRREQQLPYENERRIHRK